MRDTRSHITVGRRRMPAYAPRNGLSPWMPAPRYPRLSKSSTDHPEWCCWCGFSGVEGCGKKPFGVNATRRVSWRSSRYPTAAWSPSSLDRCSITSRATTVSNEFGVKTAPACGYPVRRIGHEREATDRYLLGEGGCRRQRTSPPPKRALETHPQCRIRRPAALEVGEEAAARCRRYC